MQYKSILRLILLVVVDAIAQNIVCLMFIDIIEPFFYILIVNQILFNG